MRVYATWGTLVSSSFNRCVSLSNKQKRTCICNIKNFSGGYTPGTPLKKGREGRRAGRGLRDGRGKGRGRRGKGGRGGEGRDGREGNGELRA